MTTRGLINRLSYFTIEDETMLAEAFAEFDDAVFAITYKVVGTDDVFVTTGETLEAMERYDLQGGLAAAWELVSAANLAIDSHKPWELARDDERAVELDSVLYELFEALRYLTILVSPAMPERARAMAAQLSWSVPPEDWRLDSMIDSAPDSVKVSPGDPLFPRLDPADYLEPE